MMNEIMQKVKDSIIGETEECEHAWSASYNTIGTVDAFGGLVCKRCSAWVPVDGLRDIMNAISSGNIIIVN